MLASNGTASAHTASSQATAFPNPQIAVFDVTPIGGNCEKILLVGSGFAPGHVSLVDLQQGYSHPVAGFMTYGGSFSRHVTICGDFGWGYGFGLGHGHGWGGLARRKHLTPTPTWRRTCQSHCNSAKIQLRKTLGNLVGLLFANVLDIHYIAFLLRSLDICSTPSVHCDPCREVSLIRHHLPTCHCH